MTWLRVATLWLEVRMRRIPNTRRNLLAGSLGLLALGSLLAWKTLPMGTLPISTVAVARADIESSVTALGTLQPRRYVDVGAQASGQIRKLHVEAGDQVHTGQLLVEI
ncbi:hemolysin secretion protein D, partial [Pseudomonas putida]